MRGSITAKRMSDISVPSIVSIPSNNTINPAVIVSRLMMASSSTGPRVGKLRTTETMTLPLTN